MIALRAALIFSLLLGSTAHAAKRGDANLILRDPETNLSRASAQVGEFVTVEVFMQGRGEQITGVELFFSFDDTFLELVSRGDSPNGPRPFSPGGFIAGTVFKNDSLDDQIGSPNANRIPLYQMHYRELIGGGFNGQQSRIGDGRIAMFTVRVIRKSSGGQASIVVDSSSPVGSKTGYYIVQDPGTTYTYRNITNMAINIVGVELFATLPDLFMLPAEVDTSLDLDDFVEDSVNPDSTFTWTNAAPDPAGISVSINPTTHVATVDALGFIGITSVVFTAVAQNDTLRDTINVIVDTPPVFDTSGMPDTIRFQEDGTDDSLLLVASDSDPGAQVIFASPDTGKSTFASISTFDPFQSAVTFTVTPNFFGEEIRTFTVTDEFGRVDTTQVLVIVDPVNDPPEFFNNFHEVQVGALGQVILDMPDFARDVDDPFDELQFAFSGADSLAFDVSSGNTRMVITPLPPFMGTRTVLVVVQDKSGATDTQNITVQVQSPDDPQSPRVLVDFLKVDVVAGSNRTVIDLGTLATDIDTPIDDLFWSITPLGIANVEPSELSGNQRLSVGAGPASIGFEPVTLTVSDPLTLSDTLAVRIYSASPVTGMPVAGGMPDLIISAGEADSLDLDFFAFDANNASDEMTWSASTPGEVLVSIDPITNVATFTAPLNSTNPTSELVFTVQDPSFNTATDTIQVMVIPQGGVLVDLSALGGSRTIQVGTPDTLDLDPLLLVGEASQIVWSAVSSAWSTVLVHVVEGNDLQLIGLVEGDVSVEIIATDASSGSSSSATLTVRSRSTIGGTLEVRDIGALVLTANRDTTIALAPLIVVGNANNVAWSTPGNPNVSVEIDSLTQRAILRPVTNFVGDAGSIVFLAEDVVTGATAMSLALPVTVQGTLGGDRGLIEIRLLVNPVQKNFLDAYVLSRRPLLTDPILGFGLEADTDQKPRVLIVNEVSELADTWVGDLTIGDEITGTVNVTVTGITAETRIALTDTVRIEIAEGGISDQFSIQNRNVFVSLPPGSFNERTFVALFEGAEPPAARAKAAVSELVQVSQLYTVHGTRGAIVQPGTIHFEHTAEPGVGVYRRSFGEWIYVSDPTADGTASGQLGTFGTYGVFSDRTPPSVTAPVASEDARSIVFYVVDGGSGVTPLASLSVDGTSRDITYEPGVGLVWTPRGALQDAERVDLVVTDLAGNEAAWSGPLAVTALIRRPVEIALHQNFPNPFNPQTTIAFELPSDLRIRVEIFNLLGQRVRSIAEGYYHAGLHTVAWDARDEAGRSVGAGVYLYRLVADDRTLIRKMLLLK